MNRNTLESYLNKELRPELFDDYCPNGLQLEGKAEIKKIVFALSATRESAEYAALQSACALIVHHGLFWKFHGVRTLTGPFYKRIKPLVKNDINLFAYHLPLDGHLEFGNAATIAKKLELVEMKPFGEYKKAYTGIMGNFKQAITPNELQKRLEDILGHKTIYSNPIEGAKEIKSIGIITGGANSQWQEAYKNGLDAYLTGEMSEHDWHESREAGIHMFAGGHHATERLGILSLMETLKKQFPEIQMEYFESENPA